MAVRDQTTLKLLKNSLWHSSDYTVSKFREALTHAKAAERLRAEAQQVQDHMTYLVTICGIELNTSNLHPDLLQLIQHGQQLLSQAHNEVRQELSSPLWLVKKN